MTAIQPPFGDARTRIGQKGNRPVAKELTRKETFQYIDPKADEVLLLGDFTNWEESPILLKRQNDGIWKATVPLEPGVHQYRFRVDGQWRDDVKCSKRQANPFGGENCVRTVAP